MSPVQPIALGKRALWLFFVLVVPLLPVAVQAQTSQPSLSSCPLCVNFVTTFDPDGTSGPMPAFTRLQRNLLVDVPYALDVTGNKPPLPLGILPVPGYQIMALLQATDPNKPTITISRLGLVPARLPLRIELVTGDVTNNSVAKQSVGYDTLDSTAPTSFKAVLDLSHRDQNPAHTQALATLTISGAPGSLTVLEEEFTGDPVGTRTNRTIHRLTFSGDGVTTHVPSTVQLDLTSAATSTHAILTHDLATDLSFDMTQPGGLPRTTGALHLLPARVDVTLADVDLNGDGIPDKKIDFIASAITPSASLRIETSSQTTDVALTALPATFHLTAAIGDKNTAITYHATSVASEAVVISKNSTRTFTADVIDVPANINELSSTTTTDGGIVVYQSDARATKATLTADQGAKHASVVVTGVPAGLTVEYASTVGAGHYHYLTSGDLATHATLTYVDDLGQRYELGADQIPTLLNVDYTTTHSGDATNGEDDLAFTYHASSPIPHAELHATNLQDLIDRARRMVVVLDGIPTDFGLTVVKQRSSAVVLTQPVPFPDQCAPPDVDPTLPPCPDILYSTIAHSTADLSLAATTLGGGQLGHGTALITSGPTDDLAATSDTGAPIDGVLYRDVADRFVISSRISEFAGLVAHQHSVQQVTTTPQYDGSATQVTTKPLQDTMHADLDTNAPSHFLQLVIDKQPHDGSAPIDETVARLAGLPTHISLDTNSDQTLGITHDTTTWSASSSVNGYPVPPVSYQAGFELTHSTVDAFGTPTFDRDVRINPMPKNFTACQANYDTSCSQGLFDDNLTKAHNGPTAAQLHAACQQYGVPQCLLFVPWFYRTFACFGSESCGNPRFDVGPANANQGTVRLQADEAIFLSYGTGDYVNAVKPYTSLTFTNLTRFVLQGHDSGEYDCGSTIGNCRYGTLDLDTDGHAITGHIRQKSASSVVEFNFPNGFMADQLVWDFKQTSSASGRHATLGGLTCPSGTAINVGGQDRTGQICNGDLQ